MFVILLALLLIYLKNTHNLQEVKEIVVCFFSVLLKLRVSVHLLKSCEAASSHLHILPMHSLGCHQQTLCD